MGGKGRQHLFVLSPVKLLQNKGKNIIFYNFVIHVYFFYTDEARRKLLATSTVLDEKVGIMVQNLKGNYFICFYKTWIIFRRLNTMNQFIIKLNFHPLGVNEQS